MSYPFQTDVKTGRSQICKSSFFEELGNKEKRGKKEKMWVEDEWEFCCEISIIYVEDLLQKS